MVRTVLIVHAHGSETSFNSALKRVAVETLTGCGHDVIVSDLYAMNFDPVFGREDVKETTETTAHNSLSENGRVAWIKDDVADDVKTEQDKIRRADLIIFQFPLYWMGLPAILKGWFDRTFTEPFAFTDKEFYDNGKLKGKRAMFSITTGAPKDSFTTYGPHGDINILLWPLQSGILRFVGLEVLAPFISYSPQFIPHEGRAKILKQWADRMVNVFRERPLRFLPISKFSSKDPENPINGMELTAESIRELQEDDEHGLTIGHHLGRRLPLNSMTRNS
ncbi:hypothetical protein LSH36_46g07042 [Paralvinella palmiformis]|uniref:Flavodoxin-like fold domain-containing protein n=1 Tax=Paralvinella palmiformis TaxID=53620 RepID=A0AAD9K6R2_9ANNE|nr:hypothetical protein LSH36_46g07042 [Paralvinella palmiformis]